MYNAQKSDVMSGVALADVEALAGCEVSFQTLPKIQAFVVEM